MTPISTLPSAAPPAPPPPAATAAAAPQRDLWDRLWGDEGFSFGALLDAINPLHHIPVVSTIYRAMSGDTIAPASRMAGGVLFGGVFGLVASAADAALEGLTGKDAGSHLMAMLPETEPGTQVADEGDRHAPLMAGLMNQPIDAPSAIAATTTDDSSDPEITDATAAGSAGGPSPVVPVAAAAAARTAQFGAGAQGAVHHTGRLVPLTTQGRALAPPGRLPENLPAPHAVAADPALLRELRQGGTATDSGARPGSGRIDTAIRGAGVVTPASAQGAASWLDYATRDPAMTAFDAETRRKDDKAGNGKTAAKAAIPTVPPDLLMRMQQALDKYQTMRGTAAPAVDVSH